MTGTTTHMTGTVRSADGTTLTYQRLGEGPAVVVCHGALVVAEDWLAFARALAATQTVW